MLIIVRSRHIFLRRNRSILARMAAHTSTSSLAFKASVDALEIKAHPTYTYFSTAPGWHI